MIKSLQKWLFSKKDYWQGVYLYSNLTDVNPKILSILKSKRNAENENLVESLITEAVKKLSQHNLLEEPATVVAANENTTDLLAICEEKASIAYKEVMNKRAVLFALASKQVPSKEETLERTKLALQIVKEYKELSNLYDIRNHVKKTGRLPDAPIAEKEEIPDYMVFYMLHSLRVNSNKLKLKEKTPKRIQIIADQAIQIEKLEKRWLLLKQAAQ